jgi:hypothetical protein
VAVVVRFQELEHFVLDVGRLGGRAHERLALGRWCGERAIEQRADALPSIWCAHPPSPSGYAAPGCP